MNLYLYDDNKIITFTLPDKIIGDFWMTDNQDKNVVNISANNGRWIINGSNNSKIIVNGNYSENVALELKKFYIVEKDNRQYVLFSDLTIDLSFKTYSINNDCQIKIGNDNTCDIILQGIPFINGNIINLTYNQNTWKIDKINNIPIYLNNELIVSNSIIVKNGDILNIFGVKILFAFNLLFINNPFNNIMINNQLLTSIELSNNDQLVIDELPDDDMYKDNDYFMKSPRLRRNITTLNMKIDSPPQKENLQETPLIYTLGPMLTMGASSIVTLTTTMSQIGSGERTWKSSIPTLVVSGAMLCSMLVWPFLTKSYERRRKKKKERERQKKYRAYLDSKKNELANEYNQQIQILEENLLSLDTCYNTILNRARTLWERKIDQSDFLTVRVGKGQVPFDAKISYQSEDFTMDDDDLKKILDELVNEFSILNNVPIGYSFAKNNITAVSGTYPKNINFVNNIILQMMAYHSYDNIKIVVFTNEKNSSYWEYLKTSLYCFSNDKSIRFFATDTTEMQDVSDYLEKIFLNRKILGTNDSNYNDYSKFDSYYLFLIDDIDLARKISIVDDILKEKVNRGFSLIILENKLSKLPSQCNNFISIGDKTSGILKNDVDSNEQIKFIDEVSSNYNMVQCSYNLSNLPIYIENNDTKNLPNTVTFLEMFGVGKVEQLNPLNRWKENNPIKSLKTEIGLNENGDLFILDLHEKQHGPHGLIAGMTGSGKSEFIITYVLSMAINYSPEEVSFVLIDYKGGGLAGAFENKKTGVKLPHIVGTITNLDVAEINRALSSIESELRRRQQKFNDVRSTQGDSTIDIYKYQQMYRDNLVDEPMPHLIIICDEFAELKAQQPDFMDDLISTARIGRSLGVHLILATQKPSGVVDAQIWSNSKFKICLKVQDKSDSMEMIKNELAAELKNVGRFYLQVGYNEYFAIGQSAWAGAKYFPSNEFKKPVDKNIYFIDNIGEIYKGIDNGTNKRNQSSSGEEATNILKYIIDVSQSSNLKLRQLWLDKIPGIILVNNLIKKYNYQKQDYIINPVIGEYDNPSEQKQGLLTLPITKEGNVLLYGSADSGRDEFLQSLVYSIIETYSTDEVNLYLLDYGAETLLNFKDAPQVGDVLINGDDEKIKNLIKLLNTELVKRKKIFIQYNGNYQDYIKVSDKKLSNIVVVVNVCEVLFETYMDLFDKLFTIIREGSKYGINFVLTTTNQNSVKFKVAQTCKQLLCLQMSNISDYRDILGKTDGITPSKFIGRGLVKTDKVCEFQTAKIDDESSLSKIKELITDLQTKGYKKARKVPVMPNIIEIKNLIDDFKGIDNFPVGINKDDLNKSLYDFSKNVINIISSNEITNIKTFAINYIKLMETNNTFNKLIIDADYFFDEFNYQVQYSNDNFNGVIDSLYKLDENIQNILVQNNMNIRKLKDIPNTLCVIFGIDKFYSKLDEEHKTKFKDILNHNKDALKINFVFIDNSSNIKKHEYDEWFKNNYDSNNGLWIGGGFTQQYIIKSIIQLSSLSNIDNEYGVLVKNGMPTVIKLINNYKE